MILLNHIRYVQQENSVRNVILLGDINFALTDWSTLTSRAENEQVVLDALGSFNYEQAIKIDHRKFSLDVILCNNGDILSDVCIDNFLKSHFASDHLPYKARIQFQSNEIFRRDRPHEIELDFAKFAYTKADWRAINDQIAEEPFMPYCYSNVGVMTRLWYQWIYSILIKHIPLQTKHRLSLAPWVTPSTSNLIKIRATLTNNYTKKPSKANLRKLEKLQTNLAYALLMDQQNHERELFKEGRFDKLQKYLRNVRRSTTLSSEMYLDGEKTRSDQDKAELFNQYFHSVYSNIPIPNDSNLDSDNATLLNHFYFNIIEIEDILKKLNINKSKGPDRMGNLLFKQLWSSISKSLMLLFNTIANKQQFPSTWKVSEILPIHKENKKQVVSNYRPICLLNATSKVLEKLMFDKMYSKVQNCGITHNCCITQNETLNHY